MNLISWHLQIDKHTMRAAREGKLARKEVLLELTKFRKRWLIAEQFGKLADDLDLIKRSRQDAQIW